MLPQINSQFAPNNSAQIPENNPVQQKPLRQHYFLITLTVLLILTGAFGVWYYANPVPEEEPENLSVLNERKKWNTYNNEIFGYELQYPSDWVIDNTYSDNDFTIRGGDEYMGGDTNWQNFKLHFDPNEGPAPRPDNHHIVYLIIYKDSTSKTIDEKFKIDSFPNEGAKILEKKDFTTKYQVVGRQYSFENLDHPVGNQTVVTIFKKGDVFYIFSSPMSSKVFNDQILSTFKFISTSTPVQ